MGSWRLLCSTDLQIFPLNKIWKLDKKNSWYLALLRKLDLYFIFGSKAQANCSISTKLLCQLLVSSLWAIPRENWFFKGNIQMCSGYENADLHFNHSVASPQLPMTVTSVNSILASSYEFVFCFSCFVEIMDKFQFPQQVKQPLVYTPDLSSAESF